MDLASTDRQPPLTPRVLRGALVIGSMLSVAMLAVAVWCWYAEATNPAQESLGFGYVAAVLFGVPGVVSLLVQVAALRARTRRPQAFVPVATVIVTGQALLVGWLLTLVG